MTSGDGYSSQKMARHGFSLCDRERSKAHYRSMTAERECWNFEKAPAKDLADRIEWIKRQGEANETSER
ncbi:hypothetical protein [Herbaspirillum huttiense]|uniref:hypothetical protein n=1 Tax=Herbaspirillum huttiense TaxID=863372 RepID=UPI003B3B1B1A